MWLKAQNGELYNLDIARGVTMSTTSPRAVSNVRARFGEDMEILYSGTRQQCQQVLEYIASELEPGGVSDVKDAVEEYADG